MKRPKGVPKGKDGVVITLVFAQSMDLQVRAAVLSIHIVGDVGRRETMI